MRSSNDEPPPPRPQTAAAEASCDEVLRCTCGSLLARYVRGGIELKCRRCKRTIVIALEDIAGSPLD